MGGQFLIPYGYIYPRGVFAGKMCYRYDEPFRFIVDYTEPFINLACAFDIETTSFDDKGTMYIWQFAIEDIVFIGRTWKDFTKFFYRLISYVKADKKHKLIVYIHNAAFEFGFMRKHFIWEKVFSIKKRKPLYFETENCQFRCSYLLSGLSLRKVAENFCDKNNQKLSGDLDYNKERYTNTPLFYPEICYCCNDVTILTAYIRYMCKKWGSIDKIPLTATGEVRQYCRNRCLYKNGHYLNKKYRSLINKLTLETQEYSLLRRGYTGGYTHANWQSVFKTLYDVDSYDFNSSYPAVMCSELFPMSKGTTIYRPSYKEFKYHIQNHCCVFSIYFPYIESKFLHENFISISKCFNKDGTKYKENSIGSRKKGEPNCQVNNGRVVWAKDIVLTITEIDFEIICKTYKFNLSDVRVGRLIWYEKGYLPKELIECVLEFYSKKTELKDIEKKIEIYMKNKGMLNSTYGMIVTDIIRLIFNLSPQGDWLDPLEPDLDIEIEKYNANKKRFLFYPWGVWIVKYATRNLWSGILTCGEDYCYSDTDSIKIVNSWKYKDYFEDYNRKIVAKIEKCLGFYNIDLKLAKPKTIENVEKPLGIWEHDGSYLRFKTLGAKRYFVEYMNEGYIDYKATVAGCPKEAVRNYLIKHGNNNSERIFELFDEDLCIPPEESEKNLITHNDNSFTEYRVDYLGNISKVHELSSISVSANSFDLSFSSEFILWIESGGETFLDNFL